MRRLLLVISLALAFTIWTPRASAEPVLVDPNFGTGGWVTIANPQFQPVSFVVRSMADGRILVAAGVNDSGNTHVRIYRFHADGQLDTTFGTSGFAAIDLAPDSDYPIAMEVDRKGRIVVAIQNALVVLTPAGTFDPSFSGDGVLSGFNFADIAIDVFNNILVTWAPGSGAKLNRYSPAGVLDPAIDYIAGVGSALSTITALTLDSQGRIVWLTSFCFRHVFHGPSVASRRPVRSMLRSQATVFTITPPR